MANPTLARRTKHSPPADIAPALKASLHKLDSLLSEAPIPGPKPWSDELERAALVRCANASNPHLALSSCGVPPGTASDWLSDHPPDAYRSACTALRNRLKSAWDWCETDLLERIRLASLDPKHWTAAAWILERSRGYVVKQQQQDGPSIVVNIGRLELVQGAPRAGLPVRQHRELPAAEDAVIEAMPVPSLAEVSGSKS